MPRRIESHFIDGPAGRLEALLEEPEDRDPREAALVCHPHPLHGGTMHNKVVHRLARALRHTGAVVLRFNFRGVNLSEGSHDQGVGEVEDARAALNWLRARYPVLPYTLAGFSFGSRVILRLGCPSEAQRLIAVGFPTSYRDDPILASCRVPKVFLYGARDQYAPRAEVEALMTTLAVPKRLIVIDDADHFFAGALDAFEEAVAALTQPTE